MAKTTPVVFISSTKEDLESYRSAAEGRGDPAGFLPRMMEYFVAEGQHRPRHRRASHELATYLNHENSHPTDDMWREAMQCWERLVRLDGNDRDAHLRLAQAYERFQRWSDAERHYREVLRIGQTPEDVDVWVYSVHLNLGEVLQKQGKYRQAIAEYEALISSGVAGEEEIRRARAKIEELKKKYMCGPEQPVSVVALFVDPSNRFF